MKVTTFVGAEAAYACIRAPEVSMDIRLEAGRSAATSLREWAAEKRAAAHRMLERADMAEAAADYLEKKVAA